MSRNSFRRARRLTRKELIVGLIFFLLLVLAVLYGMYLSNWLLEKEEHHAARFESF